MRGQTISEKPTKSEHGRLADETFQLVLFVF